MKAERHIRETLEDLHEALGRRLMAAAQAAVKARDRFHLALSGGSTPEPFYMRLVTDPLFRAVPWERTDFWLVDERCVPVDDERSNFRMIRESLIDHLPVRRRQVHPMPVAGEAPAERYEVELRRGLGPRGRLDFVLLGMGADGHTASLFPGSPALAADGWVAFNDGPQVTPPPRLTMTYPLLNAAAEVVILVAGEPKAATVHRAVADRPEPDDLPVTGICPPDGRLAWFMDGGAARDLP